MQVSVVVVVVVVVVVDVVVDVVGSAEVVVAVVVDVDVVGSTVVQVLTLSRLNERNVFWYLLLVVTCKGCFVLQSRRRTRTS